jgi:hypothetical protein
MIRDTSCRDNSNKSDVRERADGSRSLFAARLDAGSFLPGHAVAHPGLRPGRGDDDGIPERLRGAHQHLGAGSLNAIVVG